MAHSIGPEVIRWWVASGHFPGTGGSHVGLVLQSMWEKKVVDIHGVLSCSMKDQAPRGRPAVVVADMVALWVPEDDEEHGGLVELNVGWTSIAARHRAV